MTSNHTGFPRAEPAIIVKLNAGAMHPHGVVHTGSSFIHIETPTGTIETVPGFEPPFKANITFGADWLNFDPDKNHGRVHVRAVARTTDTDAPIHMDYHAVIRLDEEVWKIFEAKPDMKTMPFGHATGHCTFVVGDPRLKLLENSAFATSSRIIVGGDKSLTVETRVARVVAPNDPE